MISPWVDFYLSAGVTALSDFTSLQYTEWANIHDPFRPGEKAGFSLSTGLFHAWSEASTESLVDRLFEQVGIVKTPREGGDTLFTPVEFLVLHYGIGLDQAQRTIEELHETFSQSEFVLAGNKDDGFTKDSPKLAPGDVADYYEAVERLRGTGANSDIVTSYIREKGIELSELIDCGAGVRFDYKGIVGNDQILLPYWFNDKLVGIRERGWSYKRAAKGSMQTLWGLEKLPHSKSQTVLVVEGETDCIVTRQLLRRYGFDDIPVVSIPTNHFRREWKRLLQNFSRILGIPQVDHASTKFAQQLVTTFPGKVELVEIPFRQFDIGKDISHFLLRSDNAHERLFYTLGLNRRTMVERPRLESLVSLYADEVQEPPYLIDGILPKGALTLLVGPPKSGKTFVGLELCLAVISGQPLFGNEKWICEKPGSVLYVVEENSRYALTSRLKKMGFTDDMSSRFALMHLQTVRLDESESADELRRDINRLQPDLVVLDPFANFHLQDENSSQGVQKVLQAITRMSQGVPDTTFVVVHHTGKNGERSRGSSAIWGRMDLQFLVQPVEEDRADKVVVRVSGREVDPNLINSINLELDSSTLHHIQTGAFESNITLKVDHSSLMASILTQLEEPDPSLLGLTITHLMERTGANAYNVSEAVKKLEQGQVVRVEKRGPGKAYIIRRVSN